MGYAKAFLMGERCPDCYYDPRDDPVKFYCKRYNPTGDPTKNNHPAVPSGTFLLRLSTNPDNQTAVLVSVRVGDKVQHWCLSSGLTKDGHWGFPDLRKAQAKEFWPIGEFVML